jgi:hypothetical protein
MVQKILGFFSLLLSGVWWSGFLKQGLEHLLWGHALTFMETYLENVSSGVAFQYGPPVLLAVIGLFLLLRKQKPQNKEPEKRTPLTDLTFPSSQRTKIVLGTGNLFETVQPSGVNRTRTVSVKIENNTDNEISDGRLDILNLDPPADGHDRLLLKGGIRLSPHKHAFIPVAHYSEGTSQAKPGTWIRLAIPIAPVYGGGPGNLPVKPHTFHLKFSSSEYGLFDEVACLLSVDSNHILHLKDRVDSTKLNDVSPLTEPYDQTCDGH